MMDKYFDECVKTEQPFTITGLALALDTTRETLLDYQKKPEFSDTIKRGKTRVENYAEQRLYAGSPTGAIFALKNFGWSDKQEHELFGKDGGDINHNHKVTFVG